MQSTPSTPGELQLATEGQPTRLKVAGDWTLEHYPALCREVQRIRPQLSATTPVELAQLGALDTAGAGLLVELIGAGRGECVAQWAPELPTARQALLHTVAVALNKPIEPEPEEKHSSLNDELAHVGQVIEVLLQQQRRLLGFIGLTLETLARTLLHPRRWRITPLVAQIEQTGLNAIPIVALLTFLVGAVVAFLGATVLADFGATIYTVDLVAYSFLREFGVLLSAILLAGRTASAFAAQLGSMKANEEIDALQTIGLSPIELLVLPRVLALLVSLPILTFIGMLCGIVGGLAVCTLALDISPIQFFNILQNEIPLVNFLVGLSKAPIFAFVIAVIGCLEGFKTGGSAESVGEHTTSSVVQSIFMVILLDALAAMFFMEMDW